MKLLTPIAFASIYGITIRLLFGLLGDIMGVMSLSFFILGPLVIGFFTVFFLPRKKELSGASAFFLPWLSCLVILAITITVNLEGVICWILAYPLFAVVAGMGGIIANNIRKKKYVEIDDVENYDKWTKPDKLTVSLIFLVPVIFGIGEGERLQSRKDMFITKSVIIQATAASTWKSLISINEIASAERHSSLATLVGFPRHLKTTLDSVAVGAKRKAYYENGLYFNETISRFEAGKLLVLDIKTDPANIPPTVMDEHIIIGGKHVDLLQDEYILEDLPGGNCRLSLSSRFFINTSFNWYAGIWANYLMGDILKQELNLIRARAEMNEQH